MKCHVLAATLLLIALSVPLPLSAMGAKEKTPLEKYGRLRVDNLMLVGEQGMRVQLKGISTYDIGGTYWLYGPAQIQELAKDFRVEVIRFLIELDYSTKAEGLKPEVPGIIDEMIAATEKAGLYCIIDWCDQLHPQARTAEAKAFFAGLAEKYRGKKHLMFEIFDYSSFPDISWTKDIRPYAAEILAGIRAVDPDRIVIVGSQDFGRDIDVSAAEPLDDPQLMYSFHWYAGDTSQAMRDKVDAARALVPVINTAWAMTNLTEFGAFYPEEAAAWQKFLDDRGISSCAWSFSTGIGDTKALLRFYDGEMPLKEALSPAGKAMRDYLLAPRASP